MRTLDKLLVAFILAVFVCVGAVTGVAAQDVGRSGVHIINGVEQGGTGGTTTTISLTTISNHSSSYSITASEVESGHVFLTNTGATGAILFDLPKITATGHKIHVVLTVAEDVDINPDDLDRILVLTDADGDAISSDSVIGTAVTLISVSTTKWMPYYNGSWTDVN